MFSRVIKKLGSSLLALLLMLSLPLMVYAAQPDLDLTQTGSIRVQLRDAASPGVTIGGKLELHKVGDAVEADHNLAFVPNADFAASGISLDDVQAAGLAQQLADYAKAQNLTGTPASATVSEAAVFSDLSTGLYLLVQTEAATGYLPISPFLVSVPLYSATDDGWIYHIDAAPKVQPIPKDPVELTVIKKWKDNRGDNHPAEVKVYLLKDGEVEDTVTLNEKNGWTYTWKELDPGYTWSVKEEVPEGYKVSYSTRDHTITITNTSNNYPESDGLIQTGQLKWPVPILVCAGLVLLITGVLLTHRRKQDL